MRPLRTLAVLSLFAALLGSLFVSGCQRPDDGEVENVISFDRIADSLKAYDEVVIVLKNLAGDTVDVVFRGKVVDAKDVRKLKAPNWDGGQIVVAITGTLGGKVVYQVDTRFDPATNTRDNIVIFVTPNAFLTTTVQNLTLLVGDSIVHPPVTVVPPTLLDKTIDWEANPTGFLSIGAGHLKAVQAGTGVLTARLRSNPSTYVTIAFTIATSGLVPESLSIEPESLVVVAAGPTGTFTAKVYPAAAPSAVHWTSADTSIATVDSAGRVSGKRRGETRVSAASRSRSSVTASARVFVNGPIPVETVAFAADSLELFVGAAAETLLVTVGPVGASPAVTFTVLDTSKVSVLNGRISGKAVGATKVIAASVSNPNAKDTLNVKVGGPIPVESVAFAADSLNLLVGAAAESLLVTVRPAGSNPAVTFTVLDTSKASVLNGRISGKATGATKVIAASVANPNAKDTLNVKVAGPIPVERVAFAADSLELFVGAAAETLLVTVGPVGASPAVTFTVLDTSKVSVLNGRISGKAVGATKVIAVSVSNPNAKDTLNVKVGGPIPVESIAFAADSLNLLVGAAAESLLVTVRPAGASPAVTFTVLDTSKASVLNGRISGKAVGATKVIAVSVSNPNAKDTLNVKVAGPTLVEKVAFAFERQDILVGIAESLLVTVTPPGSNPAVTFSLSDLTKATLQNGKITGTAAGTVSVFAVSVANPAAKDTLLVTVKVPVPNDTVPPGRPTVRVSPAGPTRERRPTWSWTSGGGGAGAYQISLDRSVFDSSSTSLSDTTFRPGTDLGIGVRVLYVRERDAAGNWSPAGQAQVEIDTAGPSAPIVVGTTPTSALPRWTWSTGGGGGSGFFRSRLTDANFPIGAPESRDTVHALLSAVSGTTYTLFVQERDAAGNWSAAASHAIKYDLTKPTVAILLPQASGTFITALDTVRVSGTSTGPNAIATLTYALNTGAAVPMTPGVNGSWATPAITIPNAATSVIKVVATDNLGNTGEAQISVLRDSDPPTPPTSLSDPATPTNVATASWTWGPGSDGTAGSGLSGRYRWRLGAAAWTEVTAPSATGVTLVAGSNVFSVQEQDRAGNWSASEADTVVLDNRAPDAVTFVGIDSSYTISRTPTWTWSPSTTNGGIAEYVVKLDADPEFNWTSTTFIPTLPLTDNAVHTLTVRQRDQVPGVVGAARSFSYRIKASPANAPIVTSEVTTLPDNGLTNNPKFVWRSGGGGNGRYRARLNTEATYRLNNSTAREWSVPTSMVDGTYTLHVEEEDVLARWSAVGSFTIRLDRTGPVYTEVRIKDKTWDLRDGYVTNLDRLTITYLADGVPKELPCTLTPNNGTTACSALNSDGLGNPSTLLRNIHRRPNVVFFKPSATGDGDGSSWENARGELASYLGLPDAKGKDLWLASGDYSSVDLSFSFTWANFYGGFNAGSFPIDLNGRNKTNTTIGWIDVFSTDGNVAIIDGIKFARGGGFTAALFNLTDCQFLGSLSLSSGAVINATNVDLTGVTDQTALGVHVSSTLDWNGGKITGNAQTGIDGYAIKITSSSDVTFRGNLTISGNENPDNFGSQIHNDGNLTIVSPVSFDCRDVVSGENGTGTCLGKPHP